jgi:hypothetical protein
VAAIAYNYVGEEGRYFGSWERYTVYPYREFFWPIIVATFFLSVNSLVLGAFTRSQIAIADKIEMQARIFNLGKQNKWLLFAAWCNRIPAVLIAIVGIYGPTYFRIQNNERETFISLFMVPVFLFFGWLAEGIAEILFCQAWSEAAMCGNDADDSNNDTPGTAHNGSLINQSSQRKEPDSSKMEVGAKKTESLLTLDNLADSMVAIPNKGYSICKFATTLSLWNAVMGKDEPTRPDLPVWNVSWNDCDNFIDKLNSLPQVKASGRRYRLPTAEEWEYACRAGATGDYCKLSDGTEITADTLGEVAWFKANSNGQLHPAGQKKPNAFGLYDMHGNIEEWTSTCKSYGKRHCGGSWWSNAAECKISVKNFHSPSYPDENLGFRLACYVVK